MRARKVKGADKKLLAHSCVVNGSIKQMVDKDNTDGIWDHRVPVKDEVYTNLIENYKGKWKERFGNDNPIYVEVGSGRGKFMTTLAKENPNINYIAVEVKEEIFIKAAEKIEENKTDNILLLWGNVEFFDIYFDDKELDRIYVNFCDPWPKKRCAKRRLTHTNFLELYRRKLNNGEVHFKTDNRDLFEFSLNEFAGNDWVMKNISLDLANSKFEGNVTTEYENRFMRQGLPIYRLEAKDNR